MIRTAATLNIPAAGWRDSVGRLLGTGLTGSADPAFSTWLGGIKAYAFSKTATNTILVQHQLNHDLARTTAALQWGLHVHWMPKSNGSGNVVFQAEYTLAAPGSVFPATSTITATATGPFVKDTHMITGFANITGANDPSSILVAAISRLGGDGADTYDDVIFITDVDIHYLADRLGTSTVAPPWDT